MPPCNQLLCKSLVPRQLPRKEEPRAGTAGVAAPAAWERRGGGLSLRSGTTITVSVLPRSGHTPRYITCLSFLFLPAQVMLLLSSR